MIMRAHMKGFPYLVASLLAATVCLAGDAVSKEKKLIQYGWGVPDTSELLENIREMEKEPFDGITFRIHATMPDGRQTPEGFSKKRFEESWFSQGYENLRKVRFEKFTDNFVDLQASPGDMDWFNDKHWENACHNVGLFVKAAKIAGCKGVQFDPELYTRGDKLWAPNALKANPALFDKYAGQARIRGRQFIETIGRQMPDAVILCLHLLSTIPSEILDAPDPRAKLVESGYCLLPSFLDGMLDGIRPGMKIIDGNEVSYYYDEGSDYYRGYHKMRQTALRLVAPENVYKHQTQVSAGQAMYLSLRFKSALPPVEEAAQFENMVYHALNASDDYVWVYSERWLWWPKDQRRLPFGIQEALLNAKDRVAGVDPAQLRDLSKLRREERKGRAQAVVPALAAGTALPQLDGDLADPAWTSAVHIKAFQTPTADTPPARTQAWVAFDRENLYIAFRCDEPLMARIESVGEKHDDPVWRGDSFDVFISNGPDPWSYHHFIISPDNVHWDEFRRRSEVVGDFDGRWKSAVKKTAAAWQGELVLPWRDMGMTAPANSAELRANLCRNRKAGVSGKDYSSWSRVARGFLEPGHFGYWSFEARE